MHVANNDANVKRLRCPVVVERPSILSTAMAVFFGILAWKVIEPPPAQVVIRVEPEPTS